MQAAEIPTQLGKYTLVRKLASGGMAELFVAVHRGAFGFEKPVVIKRILPNLSGERTLVEMLLHEARIAATLSHPNIAQIFDVGVVDESHFIAMEFVHGEDLRAIVRQMKEKDIREFPIEHALAVVLGVCAGLAYAHDRRGLDGAPLNIVHRDISPQNVLVAYTGDVKIVDFGIAQSDAMSTDETQTGRLKGKIPYMSPEQARGAGIDRRSDIFAAGIMLFELTTGRRLFKGANEYETLALICEKPYPRPSEIRPDYPPELEAIVMRALAKEPSERWQTAADMQEALEEFVRRERAPVSRIALGKFMQSLFAEKLGDETFDYRPKTRAELTPTPFPAADRPRSDRPSSTSPLVTAAAVADGPMLPRGVLALGLGVLAVVVLAAQVLWWTRQPPGPAVARASPSVPSRSVDAGSPLPDGRAAQDP